MVVRGRRDPSRMGLSNSVTRRADKLKHKKVSFYELILLSEDYYDDRLRCFRVDGNRVCPRSSNVYFSLFETLKGFCFCLFSTCTRI